VPYVANKSKAQTNQQQKVSKADRFQRQDTTRTIKTSQDNTGAHTIDGGLFTV